MKTPKTKKEFTDLQKLPHAKLIAIGMKIWNKTSKHTHYLYPATWYDQIPNGLPITDIGGKRELFKKGTTDDDQRFGALPYGFIK